LYFLTGGQRENHAVAQRRICAGHMHARALVFVLQFLIMGCAAD
jgi:hypothetical protein